MSSSAQLAAYYFPGYHPEPRNELRYGSGWSEWKLLRQARPRFEGHRQPRVPVWGEENEADPKVMERKIGAASDHCLDAFIFDWYWFGGPFLNGALDSGFLQATNRERLRFALMWANHDWKEVFPRKFEAPFEYLLSSKVDPIEFRVLANHVISRYFSQPNYWLLNGCPYFSIYDLPSLIDGFGGDLKLVAAQLKEFRELTRAAGFQDLHLNLVFWERSIFGGPEYRIKITPELVERLGFTSVTSYVWIHHVPMDEFPVTEYGRAFEAIQDYTERTSRDFEARGVPYFPNITLGWDASPRTEQNVAWQDWEYPYMACYSEPLPEQFREVLNWANSHIQRHPLSQGVITINSWNEWTEGSYLEPDTATGFRHLEAIRDIFPRADSTPNKR